MAYVHGRMLDTSDETAVGTGVSISEKVCCLQVYRYAQMAFLAFTLSTLFVRGRVTEDDTVQGAQSALGVIFFSLVRACLRPCLS